MVYEYSTFEQLAHAIRALPACPIEAHVILITNPLERIANYIAICAYLINILIMCNGSDPAIGLPLTNLISQYDVQFVSTQMKLDAHITSAVPLLPDEAATTLGSTSRSTLPRERILFSRKGAERRNYCAVLRSIAPVSNFKGFLLSSKLKRYLSRHVSKDSVNELINRSRRV